MELIHVATLIHDDVVDNARTRRGVNATAVDYGNRVSVLAGDYLFAWIFKNVTLDYPHPIPNVLSATLADICDGEVLQLQALGNLDLPIETYVEIARKKTASLFAASAECGAVMGGGEPREIDGAARVRRSLRHRVSDEGRSAGRDRRRTLARQTRGKRPDRAQDDHPADRRAGVGQRELSREVRRFYDTGANEAIPAIVEAIDREGGLAATSAQIARFVDRAKAALEPIAAGAAKEELVKLADALSRS